MNRLNVGCGMTPTAEWVNLDNSFSIRLASMPNWVVRSLFRIGLLYKPQLAYIDYCRKANIRWCDAVKHLPFQDDSVDVIYSSHMVEHLDQEEVSGFLKEAYRVLRKGGTVRIVVPGLAQMIHEYLKNGDADRFVGSLQTCVAKPKSLLGRLKFTLFGPRQHHWMYDEESLCSRLEQAGFLNAHAVKAGETTIPEPGALDLAERKDASIYVEAIK